MMNRYGTTLIEVLVVITIMTILLAIAIPNYNKWHKRYSIENDTKQIYSLIQKERLKAFTQKISVSISVNGNILIVSENGATSYTVLLKNNFSGGPMDIDTRGTLSGSSIYHYSKQEGLVPQYDCVAIDDVRVKLGEYNGSKCVAK
ncbi:hypothetical protein Hipma_1088 [Hippea maritima DSM 10411]|uniref:Prepilin-type N-terminal cleavage/methylation domain-containing protein n=2 Tax=Hippea TaxID=84404 RepID=F2LWC0_HIPMA|nr:hypothetical protein Hipma_1088 [Hippea maritima DSM 10411]